MKGKSKRKGNKNWLWGILMLLIAALVVASQLGWLLEFSFWSLVAAVLAVVFLVCSITQRSLSTLPFVIAMVYIVLRNQEIVPHVATWAILLVAVLVSAGIGLLFPQKVPPGKFVVGAFFGGNDWDEEDWNEEDASGRRERARMEMGGIDNNPSISVNFGSLSRYLHADKLETLSLACNFGGIEVFFNQAELSEKGAAVHLACNFGGIDLFVPRHWRVSEEISCVFGGVDKNSRLASPAEDAPELKITGSVMFGGVDIHYI